MEHGVGESSRFASREAFEQSGHEPRGNLVVRNFVLRVTADEEIDFGAGKLVTVAFLANHVRRAKSAFAGIGGLAHWRRKPSGRSAVTGISLRPDAARKKTTASGPNS